LRGWLGSERQGFRRSSLQVLTCFCPSPTMGRFIPRDTKTAIFRMAHKAKVKTVAHYLDCHERTVTRLIDTVLATGDVVRPSRPRGRPRNLNGIQIVVRDPMC
jgi:hypothetical protein